MIPSAKMAPGDRAALALLVAEALRSDAPDSAVRDVLLRLPWAGDARLLVQCACVRPALFVELFTESPRWVARTLVGEGRAGILLLRLFVADLPDEALGPVARLVAGWAVTSAEDFTPLVLPLRAVRSRPATRFAVGFALWRLTWHMEPDWFDWLLGGATESAPLDLLAEAVPELLSVTPKAARLVDALFDPRRSGCWVRAHLAGVIRRLLRLGGRGVLLLSAQLTRPIPPIPFRIELFGAAAESDDLSRVFRGAAADWLADRRWLDSDPSGLATSAARAACRVATRGGPPHGVNAKALDALEKCPDLRDEVKGLLMTAGAERDGAVRRRVIERLREDAARARHGDCPFRTRLLAFAELLLALDARWLADLFPDAQAGLSLRVHADGTFARTDEVTRRLLAATALRELADPRFQVRHEAASWFLWLQEVSPAPESYWRWLVAAVTVPHHTPALALAFRYLLPDVRAEVAAELNELLTDTNSAIAANARAALEALNSVV